MDRSGDVAIHVAIDGVTVHMTRPAVQRLVEELNRLIAAEPAEHFHTHLGLLFSSVADDGAYRQPIVTFEDGLGEFIRDKREAELRRATVAGEIETGAELAPFEVTLTHAPTRAAD